MEKEQLDEDIVEGDTERNHDEGTLGSVTLVRRNDGRRSPQMLECLPVSVPTQRVPTTRLNDTIILKPSATYITT